MGLCITILGKPIIGDAACGDAYRDDRTERIDIRKDASVSKTTARKDASVAKVESRTERTQARCADGECGLISDLGNAAGGILGSLGGSLASGLVGPLPYIIGGIAVVGVGGYLLTRK